MGGDLCKKVVVPMEEKPDNGVRFRRPNQDAFADWENATKTKPPTVLDLVGGLLNLLLLPVVLMFACFKSAKKVLAMSIKQKAAIVAAVLVALFAYAVWPTPWSIYSVHPLTGSKETVTVRENRLTGRVQCFMLSSYGGIRGWKDIEQPKPKDEPKRVFSESDFTDPVVSSPEDGDRKAKALFDSIDIDTKAVPSDSKSRFFDPKDLVP